MKILKGKSEVIKELQPEEAAEEEGFGPPATLPELKKAPLRPSVAAPSGSPPLFIKVDKYRDIVKGIRDLKTHILNLRDALDVLQEMQKEIVNGIEIAHKTLDELNMIISGLDSFFMKPHSVDRQLDEEIMSEAVTTSPPQVDNYMRDMYGQLEKLRAQLRAIS